MRDEFCEELAFPSIWFGHARTHAHHVKLSFEECVNSELRRRDRRAVKPDHVLFLHKKVQLKQLNSNINIALKKTAQTGSITASQALDKIFMDNTIGKDNAFRFMASITGSPAYWEHQKKNVLAMVRQLGIFTFFVTLSAAETQWSELLIILKRTVDKEIVTDVSELNFEEKARLIRSDPATCALYFDRRFAELKKTWLKTNEGPFLTYKIQHMYHRIEFQHRGSPHVHMLLWLENAPKIDFDQPQSFDNVTDFIDSIISTSSDEFDNEQLLRYQFHKCTHTCKKSSKGKISCRFGAPFLPMDKTRILQPFPIDFKMSDEELKSVQKIIKGVNFLLEEDPKRFENFSDFLQKLECSVDEYIFSARSQLKSNKIYLKRAPKDCRINAFNPKILSLMQSNMDIQFVLDPYSCLQYVVDYINKAHRGLSKLMRSCVENFNNGNFSLREKLKVLANTLYNGSEISAQEASWCRLRLPMSSSSIGVEFINTGPIKVNFC